MLVLLTLYNYYVNVVTEHDSDVRSWSYCTGADLQTSRCEGQIVPLCGRASPTGIRAYSEDRQFVKTEGTEKLYWDAIGSQSGG
jgi:hypothetical protein